jgi:SecD/SecF fusion protein
MSGFSTRRVGLAAIISFLVLATVWAQDPKTDSSAAKGAVEAKVDTAKADTAKADAPKVDGTGADAAKPDASKPDGAGLEGPAKKETPAVDPKGNDAATQDAPVVKPADTAADKGAGEKAAEKEPEQKKKGPAPRLSKRQVLFQGLDVDKNGELGRPEFQHGLTTEEEMPQKAFEAMDADQSGGLTFTEFESGYSNMLVLLAIILAVIAIPLVAGQLLAKQLRMPEIGWRLSIVLFILVASIVVVTMKEMKYGIDLKGGVVLIYEVDEERSKSLLGNQFARENYMESLIGSLNLRVNPGGQKEVIVRSFGQDQVEIIIPDATTVEIESVKKRVRDAGFLEFRISVNERKLRELLGSEHEAILEKAKSPTHPNEVRRQEGDEVRAIWTDVDLQRMPNVVAEEDERRRDRSEGGGSLILRENSEGKVQALLSAKDYVSGANLTFASPGYDEQGQPEVRFSLDVTGGNDMGRITSLHKPDGNFHHRLAVVFDGKLVTAPNILNPIFQEGRITGRFSQREVNDTVAVLNAGRLPAVVREEPVQQYQIGATLGEDTIRTSWTAMMVSTALVLGFMLVYYHFAGFVACLALLFNILITVAAVMFVQAAITLPGLAGLALTVGMAVDANVLIYERIREEQAKGASLRMVIRNGFDRAFTTIFDSNVTTMITGIVLFIIGSDQVKGFAVTLIIGLAANLFTAITFTRLIFDIVEKKRWKTRIGMMPTLSQTNFDFVGKQKWCMGLSAAVILIGLAAAFSRGVTLLDIDFAGGTSVHVLFNDNQPLSIQEVRAEVAGKIPDVTVSDVRGTSEKEDTHFKIDTSLGNASSIVHAFDRRDATQDGFLSEEEFLSEFSGAREGRVFESVKKRFDLLDADNDDKLSRSEFTINVEDVKVYWLEAIFGDRLRRNSVEFSPPVALSAAGSGGRQGWASDSRGGVLALAYSAVTLLAQNDDAAKTDAKATEAKAGEEKPKPATPAEDAKEKTDTKSGEAEKADSGKTKADEPAAPADKPADAAAAKAKPPTAADAEAKASSLELRTRTTLSFAEPLSRDDVLSILRAAGAAGGFAPRWQIAKARTDSSTATVRDWIVETSATPAELDKIIVGVRERLSAEPIFPAANSIGGQVAGRTKLNALAALIVSSLAIIVYVWIRFQKVAYGVAGVVALVHDVLVTLGAIAISSYVVSWIGAPAEALGLTEFKINLPVVAAFMTIIGFSINDTIVIFDRIRELKGKLPYVTADIINSSVNQMLSRTFITSLTVIMVVVILYGWGGAEIHGFAFAMLVGLLSGVYSTWFVATPIVLWLAGPPTASGNVPAMTRPQAAALSAAGNRGNASAR